MVDRKNKKTIYEIGPKTHALKEAKLQAVYYYTFH